MRISDWSSDVCSSDLGCIYCFARPTHAYHDLSPGLDFETRLFAKPDAAALLRKELSRKAHPVSPIAMGTNTDPYQPIERDWKITRQCLEILWECRHPEIGRAHVCTPVTNAHLV